jgi:hypothetical protein
MPKYDCLDQTSPVVSGAAAHGPGQKSSTQQLLQPAMQEHHVLQAAFAKQCAHCN